MPGKSVAQVQSEQAAQAEGRDLQSQYHGGFPARVYDYCMLGATNEQLAEFLNVSVQAIELWLRTKPPFAKAVHRGRSGADAKVARSLYARANGYKHKAQKIMQYEGEPLVVDYVEHYPPDTNAAIFWLKNRQPKNWQDRSNVAVNGEISLRQIVEDSIAQAKVIEGTATTAGPEPLSVVSSGGDITPAKR